MAIGSAMAAASVFLIVFIIVSVKIAQKFFTRVCLAFVP